MSGKGLHIVLIGFMGSGKTTVAKILAERLGRPLLDTDQEVIDKEKMSIAEIFEQKGETYFRKTESEVLQSVLQSEKPSIISTGGGAPCFLKGMEYIQKNSFSFYLKVGRTTLLDRIAGDKSRPLAASKTKRELKKFIEVSLREREKFYLKANQTILAYDQPTKIVGRMLKYIDKEKI